MSIHTMDALFKPFWRGQGKRNRKAFEEWKKDRKKSMSIIKYGSTWLMICWSNIEKNHSGSL
jgi:hypothetical protein